tara:strand:- start:727 stop:2751 length:2025 start_codon:yes stop_codon:yes gene_type:complete
MKLLNRNKILSSVILLFSIILIFLIIDMTSISTKYVNKSIITFEINNVRNPQLKKLVRFFDNVYSQLFFYLSKNQKKNFSIKTELHQQFPDEILVEGIKSGFTLSNFNDKNNLEQWHRSHGNHSSNRFSDLNNINLNNIENLDLAWKFKFDKIIGDIQSNPIFADNKIIMPSTGNSILAIDPFNGKKIWEFETDSKPARRGIIFQSNKDDSHIYFCSMKSLYSIKTKDGKPNINFGEKGAVKINKKCTVTPIIIRDELIIATFEPALEVYNINTGKLKWKYYLKEKIKSRHGGKRYDYSGGNPWGGISADIERQIVFLTTGNPGIYLQGINRPGKNKYANSVIAIDIKNKKKLWDFQEVEHDIWNRDIPAPPILTRIKKDNINIDVVVAVTKLGNTLLLDRLSGKPIFDFKKIKAPLSKIPGEQTAIYQPKINLPEPFANQFFSKKHISNISPKTFKYVSEQIKNMNFGFFIPGSLDKKTIVYNWMGGAEWMGASINQEKGIMYITANNVPYEVYLTKNEDKFLYYKYASQFKVFKDEEGFPASKPPWGTLTALNLNNGKIIWQKPFGEFDDLIKKGLKKTGTPNFGGATGTAGGLVFATGTMDKKVRAFNSENGKEVWRYQLQYIGSNPPTIFSHKNEQYVLITSTGSVSLKKAFPNQVEFGNLLYCFKLKKK